MRKIVSALASLSLLVPMLALAQPPTSCQVTHDVGVPGCPTIGFPRACDFQANSICGLCCFLNAIMTATDWIFLSMMVIVAFFIIWGGFTIATAAGAPDKLASGKNFIFYALIGLAVALLARAFPAIVKALL